MGYYVEITGSDFRLPKDKLDEAYELMCALNERDDLKHGGMWGGGGTDGDSHRPAGQSFHPAKWFSWMPADYPSKCKDAADIFRELGFEIEQDGDGIKVIGYDNKIGQEHLFFEAIGHLVEEGSYITWRGEDNDIWRWFFDGSRMEIQQARVIWE